MVTVMQIILQPVLFEPDKDIISSLEEALLKEFNASSSSIVIALPIKQIPEQQELLLLFDNQRNQWKSSDVLQWLFDRYKKLYSKETRRTKILAVAILMHILIS
jgi:hypothetical protein